MIIDLSSCADNQFKRAPICVVGAGIAGLIVAHRLRLAGIHVVVLESGPIAADNRENPLNRVVSLGRPYHGALKGRARGLGGTSTMWGGALLPFLESDLADRPSFGLPAWPVALNGLAPFLRDVEVLFGVDEGPYDLEAIATPMLRQWVPPSDADFVLRFAKWPNFKKRNVASLFKAEITKDPGLEIWVNATVTQFSCDVTSGRLRSVKAVSAGGRLVDVRADHFVICAGAIESTRLLLLLDRQHSDQFFGGSSALGRFFHDHISSPVARLHPRQPTDLNRMAGFRFVDGTMRSMRFELSPAAQVADGVASAFVHISFASKESGGFDVLRDVMRSLQRSGWIFPGDLMRLAKHSPYLARLCYWRFVRGQLLWPQPASYDLNIVAEQLPRANSRISLSEQIDDLGCPVAAIDWRVEAPDIETIRSCLLRFGSYWKRHGCDSIAQLEWILDEVTPSAMLVPNSILDIYHPGGTTRMGSNPRTAIVDADLTTFSVRNLSVASTSVFPSGASANPTLMLMAFGLRLADHLTRIYSDACQMQGGSIDKPYILPFRSSEGLV